jgi:hypothetical protein
MRTVTALLLVLFVSPAMAEEACPKYGDCVPLDTFKCETVAGDACVNRLCYEPSKHYMIIWLGKNNTAYHYCDIGQDAVDAFKSASPMCPYYNANIRSKPDGTHGPFDCRDHRVPQFR